MYKSCTNTSYSPGISTHQFPVNVVTRQEWTRFVQRHRKDFKPSRNEALCSAHFEESCYARKLSLDGMENTKMSRVLIRGSVPTRDTVVPAGPELQTERGKRQVSVYIYLTFAWLRS